MVPPTPTTKPPAHRKVHVSLPAEIYDEVERRSAAARAPFSTTLSALIRQGLDREEQDRLEEALELDREANAAFAVSVSPVVSRVVRGGSSPPTTDP